MTAQSARSSAYSVALLTAGHFLSDFYANFLPALLPVIMSGLGVSLTASGLLIMVYSFTCNVLQPLCGYYVDKSGYTWLLLLTIPVSAMFISLSGLVVNLAMLFIFVALAGIGTSLFHPLGSSLVGKVTTAANKGVAMSVFVGGGNFGFAVAPIVVIYLIVHYGLRVLPWLMLPGLLLPLIYYHAGLHRINAAASPFTANKTKSGEAWYKSSSLLKLNIVMACRSWSQVAIGTLLPVLLAGYGYSPTLAGSMLTVFLVAGAVGGLVGGYIGDRIGAKNCLIASLLVCLPSVYLVYTMREINLLSWAALAVSGAALQGTMPSSVVWAQEMVPGKAAMASGMMLGLAFGLGGIGTAITGALGDLIGLQPALLWTLLPLALAIPLTYFIPAPKTSASAQAFAPAINNKSVNIRM